MPIIEATNILQKPRTRHGVTFVPKPDPKNVYNATIYPGVAINLHGLYYGTPYEVRFELDGRAVYGSYNLVYTGKIIKISANTVTIKEDGTYGRTHRLSLYAFTQRNHDYNAEQIARQNEATSYTI